MHSHNYCSHPSPPCCPPLFEEKHWDIVFGFPWCVMRCAWFRICSRYLLLAILPTVLSRSVLKLYICFKDGLKIRMYYFQNPDCFGYFLAVLHFRALIPQKCTWIVHLLFATPPSVLGRFFRNFTCALMMVRK